MLRRGVIYCLTLSFIAMAGARTAGADCAYAEVLRAQWHRTRDMLMAIVDAMPEDKWDYRPVKEVRSFREQALHLAQDGFSHMGFAAGHSREESQKLTKKYEKLTRKADIEQALKDSYAYGDQVLDTITDQNAMDMVIGMRDQRMTRLQAVLVAFEDQMDHYGNFVVYLRLNGIVPPDTANADVERKHNQEENKKNGAETPSSPSSDQSMPGMKM